MKKGICDVCFYVDNDATIKDVEYCETCNAYICDKCTPNLFRRGLAMIKKQANKLKLALTILVALSSCKKEDVTPTQTVTTQTIQPTKKQHLIVIEREYTTSFSFKINDKDIETLTANAYTGDKIEIKDTGNDTWSPSPSGDIVKNEGKVTIKVYINNELIKEANCNCDFELTKTLE